VESEDGELPPLFSSSSSSSSPPLEDSISEGVSSAGALAAAQAALQAHLLCLSALSHLLLARLASQLTTCSGRVTPVEHCARTQDPMQECVCIEKMKLTQADESELEQTHPGADNPFP
jgi:hypothetical protein